MISIPCFIIFYFSSPKLESITIERIIKFEPDELLYLSHDLQNNFDSKALMLCTKDRHNVGYCPRYLNNDFLSLIQENPTNVKVKVEKVNPAPTPIQQRLLCNLTATCKSGFSPFSGNEYQPIIDDADVNYHVA